MSAKNASRARKGSQRPSLELTLTNLWFALAGLAVIAAGYYLLGQGSISLAPVLLVLGYVVLLPLAILL